MCWRRLCLVVLVAKVGVAPRIFLKKLVVDVLDRIDQFKEFDPCQHYALTITEDKAKGSNVYSDTEVLTYHMRPPVRPKNAGDAVCTAYVKQYQDNSEITNEYITCMPKVVRR